MVFLEPFNFSFFSIAGQGIDLDYCDIKWLALEMNRDHSVIFEIASKYCISDSFVDYEGYSISSSLVAQTVKRLPTMWETWVQSLGQEDLLEKEMAIYSSILAWKIPWMEKATVHKVAKSRTWLSNFAFTFFHFF